MRQWWPFGNWRFASQALDHGWLLPTMARLPFRLAYLLARWRGTLNARWARDWAELSVGYPYIGERCAKTYREIFPAASEREIARLVRERYQTVAAEELEGWFTILGRLNHIPMSLDSIRQAMARRTPGRGLVVVMSHLDNLYCGLVGIARCDYPVYFMTSPVVKDERVHPRVRHFFQVKYDAYRKLMGGGALLHNGAEAKKTFYEVLREGGMVVVASDTPASRDSGKGTWVRWLGQRRKMADSALRMAVETDSELMAMQNWRNPENVVEWAWSGLVDPRQFQNLEEAQAREAMYAPLFAFLEAGVRAHAGKWWAAHLLGDFETAEAGEVTLNQATGSNA